MATRTVIFDGLAAWTGGQSTRARAFLERFRQYDPDTRMLVLDENKNVAALCPGRPDLEFKNVLNPFPLGYVRALRRALWQNTRLPILARSSGAQVYLSFSHYLPRCLPHRMLKVIGVANLQPFSKEGREAEVSLHRRARLSLLRARIVSAARRAGRVIALSDACRSILVKNGISADKIALIPNGVTAPREIARTEQDSILTELGIRSPYVLYVSHFYRYKNFERLVAAYARLPAELRKAHTLVLVGIPWDREYFAEIERLAQSSGIAGQVVIVPGAEGSVLATLYRRCSLFVFPSLIENSPNILLEAMAAGAPVLAADIAPMPEFGADAIGYFDPLSVDSITHAIAGSLGTPEEAADLAKRATARAALYSWDEFTRKVVELYSR